MKGVVGGRADEEGKFMVKENGVIVDFSTFKEELFKEIKNILTNKYGSEFSAELYPLTHRGIPDDCYCIIKVGEYLKNEDCKGVYLCISFFNCFNGLYKHNVSIEDIALSYVDSYLSSLEDALRTELNAEVEEFENHPSIEHLRIRLVNEEFFKARSTPDDELIYRKLFNLYAVCEYWFYNMHGTTFIRQRQIAQFNMSEDELWEAALRNHLSISKFYLEKDDGDGEFFDKDDECEALTYKLFSKSYDVSSSSRETCTPSLLLYKDILREFAEEIGDNLLIMCDTDKDCRLFPVSALEEDELFFFESFKTLHIKDLFDSSPDFYGVTYLTNDIFYYDISNDSLDYWKSE